MESSSALVSLCRKLLPYRGGGEGGAKAMQRIEGNILWRWRKKTTGIIEDTPKPAHSPYVCTLTGLLIGMKNKEAQLRSTENQPFGLDPMCGTSEVEEKWQHSIFGGSALYCHFISMLQESYYGLLCQGCVML